MSVQTLASSQRNSRIDGDGSRAVEYGGRGGRDYKRTSDRHCPRAGWVGNEVLPKLQKKKRVSH